MIYRICLLTLLLLAIVLTASRLFHSFHTWQRSLQHLPDKKGEAALLYYLLILSLLLLIAVNESLALLKM